jgi:hypothetical protein
MEAELTLYLLLVVPQSRQARAIEGDLACCCNCCCCCCCCCVWLRWSPTKDNSDVLLTGRCLTAAVYFGYHVSLYNSALFSLLRKRLVWSIILLTFIRHVLGSVTFQGTIYPDWGFSCYSPFSPTQQLSAPWIRPRLILSFIIIIRTLYYNLSCMDRQLVHHRYICYKMEGGGFETRRGGWFLSPYRILPDALVPGLTEPVI